jgi:hypothetical protein
MKRMVFLAIFFATIIGINVAFAQEATSKEKITLSGKIQTGSGYGALFGSKTSDKWTIRYDVNIAHHKGFGIQMYRWTDFAEEGNGKRVYFDLYWSGKLSKNISLYVAGEYGVFDNNTQLSFTMPYAMLFWRNSLVNVNLSSMYVYYDKLESDKLCLRVQMTKKISKEIEIQLSGWYDNTLEEKFYGAVGITQQLPKNFYLQGDVLFKGEDITPLLVLGYKF